MIGPSQGLFYDWAGESFGWVDADEQDWYASLGGPCVCLGRERVVDPDQRVLPGVSDDGGKLVAGMEGDRREADHGQVGDLEQGARNRLASAPHAVAHTIWNRVASSCSHGPCARHSRTGSSPGKNSCSV